MRVKFHEWKIKEISPELDSANGHWKQIRLKKSKTIKKKNSLFRLRQLQGTRNCYHFEKCGRKQKETKKLK